MDKPKIGWESAVTLEEWVVDMLKKQKQSSPEFQTALEFWGRDKFKEIWLKYKKDKEKK